MLFPVIMLGLAAALILVIGALFAETPAEATRHFAAALLLLAFLIGAGKHIAIWVG